MMSLIKLFKFGLITTQSTRLYNRLISVLFSSVSSSLIVRQFIALLLSMKIISIRFQVVLHIINIQIGLVNMLMELYR